MGGTPPISMLYGALGASQSPFRVSGSPPPQMPAAFALAFQTWKLHILLFGGILALGKAEYISCNKKPTRCELVGFSIPMWQAGFNA